VLATDSQEQPLPRTRWCLAAAVRRAPILQWTRETASARPDSEPCRCSMLPVAGRTCLNRSLQCPQALAYWLIARYRTVARDNTQRHATPRRSLLFSPTPALNLNEFLLPQHLWSPTLSSSAESSLQDNQYCS